MPGSATNAVVFTSEASPSSAPAPIERHGLRRPRAESHATAASVVAASTGPSSQCLVETWTAIGVAAASAAVTIATSGRGGPSTRPAKARSAKKNTAYAASWAPPKPAAPRSFQKAQKNTMPPGGW